MERSRCLHEAAAMSKVKCPFLRRLEYYLGTVAKRHCHPQTPPAFGPAKNSGPRQGRSGSTFIRGIPNPNPNLQPKRISDVQMDG